MAEAGKHMDTPQIAASTINERFIGSPPLTEGKQLRAQKFLIVCIVCVFLCEPIFTMERQLAAFSNFRETNPRASRWPDALLL